MLENRCSFLSQTSASVAILAYGACSGVAPGCGARGAGGEYSL